ncbi:hypothetical protein AGMMS50284_1440 [Clostridia bacterium]|nr:hypothetical protein AGMMS50284_1440 [Clostridia bacterium]
MKSINKMMVFVFVFLLLLVIGANGLFFYSSSQNNKEYLVSVNRIMLDIGSGKNIIAIEKYPLIEQIERLPAASNAEEIAKFYETDNNNIIIKPLLKNETVAEYIKFTYSSANKQETSKMWFTSNICFSVILIFVFFILLYIKKAIINPFAEITLLPYELAKGHLTKNLKESKNRFFGKFIWGLDMLREVLEQQKQKELIFLKEKKTLVISLSHDIKTPLSAIKLYSKALHENLYGDEEKRLQIIKSIDEKADEIENYVGDIIKTSKEDFLSIETINTEFYLSELVKNIEDYYREKLDLIKVEFKIDVYENCLIYGDIERSVELFQNIIENAIKYGDGKIITLNFTKEEHCQLITVTNTGCTLLQSELVHVFDSFWRGSNTKDKNGSGLGLYICRQIAVKMNGDIFAEVNNNCMNMTVVFKML